VRSDSVLEGANRWGRGPRHFSMSRSRLTQLITELSAHPGLATMASTTLSLAQQAYRSRDFVFPRPGSPTLAGAIGPAPDVLKFGDFDLADVFLQGARSSEDLDVLTALVLLGASATWPREANGVGWNLASCLLWLETYSGLQCLSACEAVLDGARQRQVAEALIDVLGAGPSIVPAPSLAVQQIARAWIACCSAPECSGLEAHLNQLGVPSGPIEPSLTVGGETQPVDGDMGPRPRHPITTVLLAVTGLLFVLRASSGLAKLVLLRRSPTSVWLSERGVELLSRHEILGRVIKERRLFVPLDNIQTVEREVQYPRFGLYTGLVALALGTLVGTRLFVDGIRAAGLSYPLIGMGIAFIVLGLVLDLALSGVGDSLRGHCRLVVSTRRGRGWAIGGLERSGVDRLLTELSTRLAVPRT